MSTSAVDYHSLQEPSPAGCAVAAAKLDEIDLSCFTSYGDLQAFLWEHQQPLIRDNLEREGLVAAVHLAGSEHAAEVLDHQWQISPVDELREALVYVWTATHQPLLHLSRKRWTAMFKRAGVPHRRSLERGHKGVRATAGRNHRRH